MRIATWNVNSLKARQDAVEKWLKRADPDVLLMQETKLADADAPLMWFQMAGYELVHHGEGRWNGVAIATRVGGRRTSSRTSATGRSATAVRARPGSSEEDFNPFDEARMLVGGLRRDPARLRLRPERPRRRQPVLRRQAALVRAARAAGSTRRRSTDGAA